MTKEKTEILQKTAKTSVFLYIKIIQFKIIHTFIVKTKYFSKFLYIKKQTHILLHTKNVNIKY